MKILVTGAAGFIGMHASRHLMAKGHHVVGLDVLNSYYDVNLKRARLAVLKANPAFSFEPVDICDHETMLGIFSRHSFDKVVHLAAQPGVRYSKDHPFAYVDANLRGFVSMMECARQRPESHFIYASTSSVYGLNETVPFKAEHSVDHPISLYAATKRANELLAHSYSHLYNIPTTGLRFFTVYGPYGRPDMGLFQFTQKILAGEEIEIYNFGKNKRDFTFVYDIVESILRVVEGPLAKANPNFKTSDPTPAASSAPYEIFNIGSGRIIGVEDFVSTLEEVIGKKAIKKMVPAHPGDVEATWADLEPFSARYGNWERTHLKHGVSEFVRWYREYYRC